MRDAPGDVPLRGSGSPYLVSPGWLAKDDGSPYQVFTPALNRWRGAGCRMSAQLKFGTIHPRTMVADLDARRKRHAAYLRELAFRDFYAA